MPKSQRNCCVVDCNNTENSCGSKNIRFYRFRGKLNENNIVLCVLQYIGIPSTKRLEHLTRERWLPRRTNCSVGRSSVGYSLNEKHCHFRLPYLSSPSLRPFLIIVEKSYFIQWLYLLGIS